MKSIGLYEKVERGSAGFPIQYYYVSKEHISYEMPAHWHREFEILRVKRGSMHLYLNGVDYSLKRGDIALIGGGVVHSGKPDDCVYECVVFDLNMLCRSGADALLTYILPIINGAIPANCLLKEDNGIVYITACSLIDSLSKHSEYYEFSVYANLYRLFGLLLENDFFETERQSKRNEHQSEIMTTLLNWIEKHYPEHISLAEMASLCGMNEKYLCRLFKSYTNRTPMDYVNRFRIDCSAREIALNNCTVTEAAFECGFNDLSYFSRTFRKYKGVTPKQYAVKYKNLR